MNIIEKIIANHSVQQRVQPGDIVDVFIDTRVARDFGGANVVKNLLDHGLEINDPSKTFFTFDCNPGGSDQKYATNQHYCRQFARQNRIQVFDVDAGIGTHLAIDNGLAWPGSTFVSTDSHANILGGIGSFGQGMGDQDIAAVFAKGCIWFKVPPSVRIVFEGEKPEEISAKDIALNMLNIFGANQLLGYSVELSGPAIEQLTLDERITISSMGTEMGAIILFMTPNDALIRELRQLSGMHYHAVEPDPDTDYEKEFEIDISLFKPMVANPGHPHDTTNIEAVKGLKIDSAFIGSCTNGRISDLRTAASILKGRKIAPGIVLKIVPATDQIWKQALDEGLITIFKEAGAMVSNAGCAGCAEGQVGQNGPGEATISTGNRNFAGKQGKGFVYLASPAIVAASAVAGSITVPQEIPLKPAVFEAREKEFHSGNIPSNPKTEKPFILEGRTWYIQKDDIDTDMIYHNRYLTITDIHEMGKYCFDNLKGYEDFSSNAEWGDIIIVAKNFGAGSSRQQAVDCFISLGISCIIAESFGAIYERNAINAALPVLTYKPEQMKEIGLTQGDHIRINLITGELENLANHRKTVINKFYDAQKQIYQNGGLL
ncbi:MAG: aconitase/3-isopropylmalate dehydratase large subunit family protein [Bacteroidota bacterium]|nr:aconitase/3-isopropylmalate dehydratase large subunit family protein [Bacteroidota bacterium]